MIDQVQSRSDILSARQTRRTFLKRASVFGGLSLMLMNFSHAYSNDSIVDPLTTYSRAKKLDFVPSRDGFHFPNDFTNHLIFGMTTAGRCGGMAYAALDYYHAGLPIPTHTSADFGPSSVPADGTALSNYIWWRLINSLIENGPRFISLPWITDEQWFSWSTHDAFTKLRQRIDQGHLTVLGLLSKEAGHPERGHQVIAYGYAVDAVTNAITVNIWDNNYPDREVVLQPINPSVGIQEAYAENPTTPIRKPWKAFFAETYHPHYPMYLDIALKDGINVHAPSLTTAFSVPTMHVNERLEIDVTVRNYGDYPAELSQLFLHVQGPSNETLDHLLGGGDGNSTPLQPGEERSLHRACERFGPYQGRYTIRVAYLSKQGHWIFIPPGNAAASNTLQIDLVSPYK